MSSYSTALRLDLLVRLAEARAETDKLFAILKPEVLYDRPISERHRIVFYIGHLEAFDWNLLRGHLQLDRFHPEFDRLFAFGIDPVDGELPSDQPSDWPTMSEVEGYRRRIRTSLDAVLADCDESEELVTLMNIAIEHRLMHAETLEYMFHQLPFEAKVGPRTESVQATSQAVPQMVKIPAGQVVMGLERSSGEFGWDNEFESVTAVLPAFDIDKYKVTNRQYLEFVRAGGYSNQALWSAKDWEWVSGSAISRPVFWIPVEDGFEYRGMFRQLPLPLDAPVYVSHAEASAYARWLKKALPTEAQWMRAAEGAKPPAESRTLWDPPLAGYMQLGSTFGVEDLFGSGWEWTSTEFAPFPGFKAHPAYPGYSANFFDGKHFVLKGGSTRTAASMLRRTFRNWFQPHYQYVYAGFRCVAE